MISVSIEYFICFIKLTGNLVYLEMYTQLAEELKGLKTDDHELFFKKKKDLIRKKFLAD